jgi:hypothetical protein
MSFGRTGMLDGITPLRPSVQSLVAFLNRDCGGLLYGGRDERRNQSKQSPMDSVNGFG